MAADQPVALVTGGARRIGASICEALHGAGYRVAVHYRRSERPAHALAARLDGAAAFPAALDEPRACAGLVEAVAGHFGGLDLLVNNASSFFPTPLGSATEAEWDELMGSNLKAPFFLAQAAAAHLAAREGSIVNLTDVHAERPLAGHPVYSAAKAGLAMLTRALAREMGPAVRVNAVAPGTILWPESGEGEAARPELLERTALKRRGEPADVAGAVLYLAGARYVTGHVLVVDGGRSLNM